jgi:hypothetical protein
MSFPNNLSIKEEAKMISSPCANCNRKNQPKELCAKDCEILESIQLYQASNEEYFIISAIDCTEEGRFSLNSRDVI